MTSASLPPHQKEASRTFHGLIKLLHSAGGGQSLARSLGQEKWSKTPLGLEAMDGLYFTTMMSSTIPGLHGMVMLY